MKKIAIMQPYFFPYIGYFQLINAVDEFVVYDNIEYTKKGWINRNRILVNGKDSYISLPLKKDSDFLDVRHDLADNWLIERNKMLNRIIESYRKALYFDAVYPVIEKIVLYEGRNLFSFILNSLIILNFYLEIQTPLLVSSTIPFDNGLNAENKIYAICKVRKANYYINPIGGVQLYCRNHFKEQGIALHFLKTTDFIYKQFKSEFIPFLSIIDVMMFNPKEEIREYLNSFCAIV